MRRDRNKRIKEIFYSIHGYAEPSFYWQFHLDMRYWYNEDTDTLDCDCGLVMPITLNDDELNERNIRELIRNMESKIYRDYRDMGWDIGWFPD